MAGRVIRRRKRASQAIGPAYEMMLVYENSGGCKLSYYKEKIGGNFVVFHFIVLYAAKSLPKQTKMRQIMKKISAVHTK